MVTQTSCTMDSQPASNKIAASNITTFSPAKTEQRYFLFQGSYRNRKSKFQDFSRTIYIFFQESFFIDSISSNTAYTQDFYPSQDR